MYIYGVSTLYWHAYQCENITAVSDVYYCGGRERDRYRRRGPMAGRERGKRREEGEKVLCQEEIIIIILMACDIFEQ